MTMVLATGLVACGDRPTDLAELARIEGIVKDTLSIDPLVIEITDGDLRVAVPGDEVGELRFREDVIDLCHALVEARVAGTRSISFLNESGERGYMLSRGCRTLIFRADTREHTRIAVLERLYRLDNLGPDYWQSPKARALFVIQDPLGGS